MEAIVIISSLESPSSAARLSYSSSHLELNTSAVKGLPPGPICNPGIDAIRAALYPSDTDYYFFAHDKAGNIYTASTFKEHKNNLVLIIKANSSTD